jgi:hypothetical protein
MSKSKSNAQAKNRVAQLPAKIGSPAPVDRLLQPFQRAPARVDGQPSAMVQLAKVMRAQLPFFRRAARGFASHRMAVREYVRATSRINYLQRDLLDMLVASLIANVDGRHAGEKRHVALLQQNVQEKVRQLAKQLPFHPAPIATRLNVELTQQPLDQLVWALQEDLIAGLVTVATRYLNALETAWQRKLLGRIDWVGPSGCNLTFFKWAIIQADVQEVRGAAPVTVGAVQENGLADHYYLRQMRGVHEHREALHLYGLMNAKAYKFPPPEHPVPTNVRTCLDAIAPWLRPLIRYVDGTQIKALVVERDVQRQQWQDVQIDRVQERPVYRPDPAITFLDFVLTGWTDAEQRQAVREHRQQQQPVAGTGLFARLFDGH